MTARRGAHAGTNDTRGRVQQNVKRRLDMATEEKPGHCQRCGTYALLRPGYPYCTTCLIILAEGERYLFTVGG